MADFTQWRDPIEAQLLEVWRFVLENRDVGTDDDWSSVGGNSLDALDVAWRMEEIFAIKFPLSLFLEEPTIARQAEWLRANVAGRAWNPIVRLRQGAGRKPFFCIHPIAGNVLCYTDIATAMEAGRPFYAIQAKGLDGVEDPLATIPEMAEHYVAAIRGVQGKGPYSVGGWSAGGMLAFEVAQRLRAQGQDVALLAMIDTVYPSQTVSSARRARLEREELERFYLNAPEPAPEAYREGRRIYQLLIEELLHYTPQPYDGRITMICAEQHIAWMGESIDAIRQEMRKGPFGKTRRALRRAARFERVSPLQWRKLARGGFELLPVDGNHISLIRGENAATIARLLAERLP